MYKKICMILALCLILCASYAGIVLAAPLTDDSEEQIEVKEFTNFSGGVLVDDGEGNYCEILNMGQTENGYTITYTLSSSYNDGRPGYWNTCFLVNGIFCNEITDSRQDEFDLSSPDTYFFIPQEWMDNLGITEI